MPTSVIDIIKANVGRRKELQGELRKIDEKATEEKRAYNEGEEKAVAEFRAELEAIDGRITSNLEQEQRSEEIASGMDKMLGLWADRDSGEVRDDRTMGQRFSEAPEIRSWGGTPDNPKADGKSPRIDANLSFRAVTDIGSGLTSGGAFVTKQRLDRVGNDFLNRKTYLLDLLPVIPMTSNIVEYVQDVSPLADLADKAIEVTEGTAKPQAGPTLALKTEAPALIAAWANITRQIAADSSQLMGYIDGRLRYSLKRRADKQAINGSGVAPNILGLLARTGILAYAPGAAEARFISIRHGIRLMEDVETVPEIIVLNPADAELFDLSNSAANGLHAADFNGLISGPSRTAWGLTQVHSTAIAAGTALLIDPTVCAVLDRMTVQSYITDSHASQFISNILTLLLEVRIGLALFDPKGILAITFNGTT